MQKMGDCAHVFDASSDLAKDVLYVWAKFRRDSISKHSGAHGNRGEFLTYTIVKLTRDTPAFFVL